MLNINKKKELSNQNESQRRKNKRLNITQALKIQFKKKKLIIKSQKQIVIWEKTYPRYMTYKMWLYLKYQDFLQISRGKNILIEKICENYGEEFHKEYKWNIMKKRH